MGGKYEALTTALEGREEAEVILTFDELDSILEGLPHSARTYSAWWANKITSQAHSRAWLNAGRTASPDFRAGHAVFSRISEDAAPLLDVSPESDGAVAYLESSLSLERDLELHLVDHLDSLEPGLSLIGRQVGIDVGRIDVLARGSDGQKVIIELKVGEAKDSAVGQVARYMGWYAKSDGTPPRAILVAASFPEPLRYAAAAIPGLRLATYRVLFSFEDVSM